MNLKFYLNNQEVHLLTDASFTETQDESLDTGVATLEYNSNPNAIAPMTPFRITDSDTNESIDFLVILDTVEAIKKSSPTLYKHTLTFTQNTATFEKIQVRNSVFAKSINSNVKTRMVFSGERHLFVDNNDVKTCETTTNPFSSNNNRDPDDVMLSTPFFSISGFCSSIEFDISSETYIFENANQTTGEADTLLRTQSNLLSAFGFYIVKYNVVNDTITELGRKLVNFTSSACGKHVVRDSEIIDFINDQQTEGIMFRLLPCYSADYSQISNESVIGTDLTGIEEYGAGTYYSHILDTIRMIATFNNSEYSLYEVISELLEQSKKYYNGESSYSTAQLFKMPLPDTDDYNTLKNTASPTFTFTQSDLYSCLAEVLAYIDAVPTLSSDRTLGIEYFSNNNATVISNPQFNDKMAQLSDKEYVNKLTAYYQQARQKESTFSPMKNRYRKLAGKEYGVIGKTEYIMPTSFPIDYIDKVKVFSQSVRINQNTPCYYRKDANSDMSMYWEMEISTPNGIDISEYIFEEKEYALLSNSLTAIPSRQYALRYSQGTNYLDFGGIDDATGLGIETLQLARVCNRAFDTYFGLTYRYLFSNGFQTFLSNGGAISWTPNGTNYYNQSTADVTVFDINVEYHALHDGRVSIESPESKYDGELLISQNQGATQLDRLGANMLGLVSKLGNERRSVQMPLSTFNGRIRKGQIWNDNGERYIANRVKTTFSSDPNKVVIDIEFAKNYNEKTKYTNIDSAKRFYEIDSSLTQKGYETITEYLVFTHSPLDISQIHDTAHSMTNTFVQCLINRTLDPSTNTYYNGVSNAIVRAYETATSTGYEYGKLNNLSTAYYFIEIPIHTYGFGNCVCFEMSYEDPINAGNRLEVSPAGQYYATTTYLNKPTLYAGRNGLANYITFSIENKSTTVAVKTDTNYPLSSTSLLLPNSVATIGRYKYLKRPNEILHLNYQVALLPAPNREIYFGDRLLSNNALITADNPRQIKKYVSPSSPIISPTTNYLYSINDKKAVGNEKTGNLTFGSFTRESVVVNYVDFVVGTLAAPSISSFCLADENDNILIAVNNPTVFSQGNNYFVRIYYYPTRYRQ